MFVAKKSGFGAVFKVTKVGRIYYTVEYYMGRISAQKTTRIKKELCKEVFISNNGRPFFLKQLDSHWKPYNYCAIELKICALEHAYWDSQIFLREDNETDAYQKALKRV